MLEILTTSFLCAKFQITTSVQVHNKQLHYKSENVIIT
jgi:hypothetical protein